jgi:thermitase
MSKYFGIFTVGAMVLAGTAFGQEYVPGQLMVKFKPAHAGDAARVHSAMGASVKTRIRQIGWETVNLPPSMSVAEAAAAYKRLPQVEAVTPNYIRRAFRVPNDPRYNEQYDKPIMNMPGAWDFSIGKSTVVVAILDTGVQVDHPEFQGKIVSPRNTIDNTSNVTDVDGHGTHCAGIAAAKGNNGVGIAGVSWDSAIMPVKVLGDLGGGTLEDTVEGMIWAADNGAKVISMSLGGAGTNQSEADAVNYGFNKGAVMVAAAGNDNSSQLSYPAAYENCIAVGSTDRNDAKSGFSNFGDWVDVAGPGSDILSTLPNSSYGFNSGTSMACPNVAGVAAVLFSYAPTNYTNVQIRAVMEATTKNVGTWLRFGRVDALAAIRRLPSPTPVYADAASVIRHIGHSSGGNVRDLILADGRSFRVASVLTDGLGSTASALIKFRVTRPRNTISSPVLRVVAYGSGERGLVTVWLKNVVTGRWDVLKNYALPGPSSGVVRLPFSMDNYMASDGQVQVVIRGMLPLRQYNNAPPQFVFNVDSMRLQMSRLNP